MKKTDRMQHRRLISNLLFITVIIFLAAASFISYQRIVRLNQASNLVVHANEIKQELAQTMVILQEAEADEQRSIRLNSIAFNKLLQTDSAAAYGNLQELDSLTHDNLEQQARVHQLQNMMGRWLENLHAENFKATLLSGDISTYSLQSQNILRKIDSVITEMTRVEDALLLKRLLEKDRSAFLTPLHALLFSFIAILIVTGAYFRLRRETRLRQEAEDAQSIIRNFFQQAPAMLAILNGPDHVFEFANPPFRDLIGGRNPIGMPVRQAVPEVSGQGYYEILDAVYRTGEPFTGNEMPLQVNRSRGLVDIYINIVLQVLKDASGEITGVLVFCYEVTEQVKSRTQLQELESRSRLAIEAANMGTFDWNLQNQQFISSERLVQIFGFPHSEKVKHQDLLDRFHPDDKQLRDEAVLNSFTEGSLKYEVRVIWPDQSVHWISVYGKIFTDDEKNVLRMYGTAIDTTQQRQALEEVKASEARLKQFMQDLEKKVFERTQSLNYSNIALKQSVNELEQTNAELASFNYIASHDLQEPLRKIIAFSKRIDEVERDSLSEVSRDYFSRIVNAASRMQSLIDAFLSYSQTSNVKLALEKTDLNKILDDVKADLSDTAEQKNASIENSDLPVISAIPLQVNQLFTNLIGNALKYSRKDVPPKIEITAEEISGEKISAEGADAGHQYWKITIRDNGIGFDQIHENQIFDVFKRLHSRQDYAGTGIGLAICKKIMRNHNGFINAKGETGSGASFSMYFPFS